jgi:hypothetical protein
VRQNFDLLSTGGEACFLLKRLRRATDTFQVADRRVDFIEKTLNTFSIDPDTGMYRAKLWGASTDPVNTYPDVMALVCTVTAGAVSTVWESAVDKYSFIPGRTEYAFDIYQNQLDALGNPIEDSVYIIFNTPPFDVSNTAYLKFGNISPAVHFEAMQPIVDNQVGFQNSLFSFDQWIKENTRIRGLLAPNRFLLAFPGVLSDFTITAGGLLRESSSDFWTTPPPYSPKIEEHDVVVRESTGQRFNVINLTPIMIEKILVSQHLDMAELDPKSSIYNIDIEGWVQPT